MRIIWWSGGAPGSQAVRSVHVLLRLRPRCCSGGLCGCGRAVVCSVVIPCVGWCSETPRCVGSSPRSPQARHRPTERRYRRGEIQTEQKTKKISYLGGIPVRLVLVGRPRRPTDRRRSSDEHTNKREVELTSISQQTPIRTTARVLALRARPPSLGHLRSQSPSQSNQHARPLERGKHLQFEANTRIALLLSAAKKIQAFVLST